MIAEAMMAAKGSVSKTNQKQMPGNVGLDVGKLYAPTVMNAIKASPAGMFPAAASKAGIGMNSKLGQAITKSGAGKIPTGMKAINRRRSRR